MDKRNNKETSNLNNGIIRKLQRDISCKTPNIYCDKVE